MSPKMKKLYFYHAKNMLKAKKMGFSLILLKIIECSWNYLKIQEIFKLTVYGGYDNKKKKIQLDYIKKLLIKKIFIGK